MKKKDWKIVEEIVSEALLLPRFERQEFIDSKSEAYPELASEIESLIKNEAKADSFFDSLEGFKYEEFFEELPIEASIGQEIGSYKILGELGTGGMGAVFLAERTDGEFNQKVAIKMLRREFNTSVIRKRFEKEKEIQSRLVNPNIAHLIDAGSTEDGIPYLVMEYTRGIDICEYSNRENLSLKERLKLFNKVCDAVAFAHKNLIIHRDLKPSNIIVTEEGEPKLLDFGISKLISDDTDETQTVTRLGVMTPEYASPEQIQRESVTTATDVYSLGVILFELLTGERPFEKELSGTGNIFKTISEKKPEAPSDVLLKLQTSETPDYNAKGGKDEIKSSGSESKTARLGETETLEFIGETRQQFSSINPKQLRGDLDNIILKALRKEPERRYQTVEGFSTDIWRHLDGMPVSARPSTFNYRASKFIKRNRVGVIASAFVLIAILGGLFTTAWQARRAEIERAKAEKRFGDVRSLARSILFDVYPTVEKLDGSIDARKRIVENALKYLDGLSKEASGNMELQMELAEAYRKIGDVQGNNKYPNLGDLKGSSESYKKAVGLIREVYRSDPKDVGVKSKLAEALEEEAFVLWWMGDNPNTYKKYKEAISLYEDLIESDSNSEERKFALANLYLFYGDVPFWENKIDQAGEIYEKAHQELKRITEKNAEDSEKKAKYAYSFGRLAKIDISKGRLNEAEKKLEISEKIAQKLVDENPKSTAFRETLWGTQFSKCEMYLVNKNTSEAVTACPKIIKTQKKMVEIEPNNNTAIYNLAISHSYLGRAYRLAKVYDRALLSFDESIKNLNIILKESPKNIGYRQERIIAIHSKAGLYEKRGNLREAQRVFEQVADSYKKLLEEVPNEPRSTLNLFKTNADLGKNLLAQNKLPEAKTILEESLKQGNILLKEKALGEFDKKMLERVKSNLSELE